jgi:phosphatidylinositol alpha-mannosyltransferase
VPVVLGTVVAQTFLNILALVILGVITFSSVNFFAGHEQALVYVAIVPIVLLVVVLMAPIILRYGPGGSRFQRVRSAIESVHQALLRVRDGLAVFRDPKLGAQAAFFQLLAWALQATSCYLLLVALGLSGKAGFAGAAAVLFAVNVTAAGDAVEPRRVPAGLCHRAAHRLPCRLRHRNRLRRDPPGGGGHDGDPAGRALFAQGGHVMA